ncbi:HNH endonuclease [Tatumella saanichensis]|uniref:HNH endonuclease n=1 Tax=Tatumella saanichensis TaxID=480813 RepID=UPI001565ABEB|nr:HNH endonuclease [Tatumella saanichensis]
MDSGGDRDTLRNKSGYPTGKLVRAVWDCCDDLFVKYGRVPTRQEFKEEIAKREPERVGISTHSRQYGEWKNYHKQTHGDQNETELLLTELSSEVFEEGPENFTDFRRRVLREVVLRQGQPQFRKRLLKAYRRQCAVTGCTVDVLLEAAHIVPYAGASHTKSCHGILLKSDIHTLFDRGLLWIDDNFKVRISDRLHNTEYKRFDGQSLLLPDNENDRPLKEHLAKHREMIE